MLEVGRSVADCALDQVACVERAKTSHCFTVVEVNVPLVGVAMGEFAHASLESEANVAEESAATLAV